MNNPRISQKVLTYRDRKPEGYFMSKKTFAGIVKKAEKVGYSDPQAVAGKAYWQTVKAKYREDHKRNPGGLSMKISYDTKHKLYFATLKHLGKSYEFEAPTKRELWLKIAAMTKSNPKKKSNRASNGPHDQDNAIPNKADNIKSMVEIYGQALETHARKGKNSAFPHQEFVHDWNQPGTKILGLPAGTQVCLPDGDVYNLTTRCIIMVSNKHDLWDLFQQ
jgi:hypothetical protein